MDVGTIAVVGAGPVGRGIAYAAAFGGYRTILEDITRSTLDQGLAYVRTSLDEDVARGKITPEQRDRAVAQLGWAHSVEEACREADIVIEATAEDMEMKLEIFTLLDRFAKPGAIFASNTPSLSITEIAAITCRPEKCVGMRFFSSLPKMNLLEIVRGLKTSDDTIATCREVGARMGKEIAVVHDVPGSLNVPATRGFSPGET